MVARLLLIPNYNERIYKNIFKYSKFGIISFYSKRDFADMAEQYIDEELLIELRQRLWQVSRDKKITLEDVEDRTGFSYSQVYRIIRGKNNISVSGLIAVCRALELQPKDLFNFEIAIPKYPSVRKLNKRQG